LEKLVEDFVIVEKMDVRTILLMVNKLVSSEGVRLKTRVDGC